MKDFQTKLCVEGVADRFRRSLVESGADSAMNFDLNVMRFSEVMAMCVKSGIDIQPVFIKETPQ